MISMNNTHDTPHCLSQQRFQIEPISGTNDQGSPDPTGRSISLTQPEMLNNAMDEVMFDLERLA